MITLGQKYTDSITGFTGSCTAYTQGQYQDHVTLQPKVSAKNPKPQFEAFNVQRVDKAPFGLNHPRVENNVKWGKTYTDKITGFKGAAVFRAIHVSGCVQIGLQPPVDKDGKIPDIEMFDEDRLDLEKPVKRPATGGPPVRTSLPIGR